MHIYLNKQGQMDVKKINKKSTVYDFLKAIDDFLEKKPLLCQTCLNNCCKRDWNIELDVIFVNRLLSEERKFDDIIFDFIHINNLNRPIFKHNPCHFLNKNNLCSIYESRPFICRGYTCYEESENYKIIRDLILDALNICLLVKMYEYNREKNVIEIAKEKFGINIKNLPIFKTDYKVIIFDLFMALKKLINEYKINKINKLIKNSA